MVHFVTYANDGMGLPAADQCGDVIDVIARILFIFILLLLAAGWTISSKIGEGVPGKWAIVIIVFLVFVAWVSQLVADFVEISPEDVNPPTSLQNFEYFVLAAWFVLAVWFIVRTILSYQGEDSPVKKKNYIFVWGWCIPYGFLDYHVLSLFLIFLTHGFVRR